MFELSTKAIQHETYEIEILIVNLSSEIEILMVNLFINKKVYKFFLIFTLT